MVVKLFQFRPVSKTDSILYMLLYIITNIITCKFTLKINFISKRKIHNFDVHTGWQKTNKRLMLLFLPSKVTLLH
jgi:hypothetical protein